MAVANRPGIFTPKPTDTLVAEAQERGHSLKRVVGLLDLSALGLGAIAAKLCAASTSFVVVYGLRRSVVFASRALAPA